MNLKPVLINPPIKPAIEVSLLRSHLRIDNNAENEILELIIGAATERIEEYIDMKLIKQRWAFYFNGQPSTENKMWWDGVRQIAMSELNCNQSFIRLPFGKIISEDYSLEYYDSSDSFVQIPSSNYQVDNFSKAPIVKLNDALPSSKLTMNGYRFVADIGMAEESRFIPNAIKQALLIYCARMYENKGDDQDAEVAIPQAATALLATYRSIKVG